MEAAPLHKCLSDQYFRNNERLKGVLKGFMTWKKK